MKRVHSGPSLADLTHLQNLLTHAGIGSFIKNALLTGGAGDLPFLSCEPELWVYRDDEEKPAVAVIREALTPVPPSGARWRCANCNEANETQFAACWRCGAADSVN